jgi:U3 small nucleolar RNA-associated protein 7
MSIKQNGHMAEVAHKNESKKRKRDELGGGLEDSHETKKKKRPKTKAEIEHNKQIYAKSKKYSRGSGPGVQSIEDKKLKRKLTEAEKIYKESRDKAARAEILLPDEVGYLEADGPIEDTYKFKQRDIKEAVDQQSASKIFDLTLDKFGPYSFDYTRSGRYMVLGGEKGHVALMDCSKSKVMTEMHLNETVRDVCMLHNETMFAVAQKRYVYIYDKQGVEIHRLKNHPEPLKLEFLPYHFLLASTDKSGSLHYQDTSTGAIVADFRTHMGACHVMRQNPRNAILHLGHHTGVVTLWSPNMGTPLVKMLCHKGPVNALAVDPSGYTMVTAGADRKLKVWDLRNYKEQQMYMLNKPVDVVDISQLGVLATGFGPHVHVWRDYTTTKAQKPYMTHDLSMGGRIFDLHFTPFDDTLGIGHMKGFSQILVPGSGEPNFDTFEANPFETKKQRRESTVVKLLEKIQPSMINLDTNLIGTVTKDKKELYEKQLKAEFEANNDTDKTYGEHKTEKQGKVRKEKKKRDNIKEAKRALKSDENRQRLMEKRQRELKEKQEGIVLNIEDKIPKTALGRFAKKNNNN